MQAPGVGEVVLGSRAHQRRFLLAVDEKAVVALAEPARLGLHDREHRPDVEPAALHVEEDVRAAVVGSRELLPVARMKVRGVWRQRRALLPVHVVVEMVHAAAALVRKSDSARPAKRHRPVAVAGPAVGTRADHRGLDGALEPVADGEEVAERSVDRRLGAPVVVDAQAHQARPAVFVGRHRDPEVRDHARPFEIR